MKRIANPNQLQLLDLLKDLRPKIEILNLNIDVLLRTTLAKVIRESQLSRIQIAAKMSEALDREITKTMLDSWTAESREGLNYFPACHLPIFCEVLGSIEPMRVLADPMGCYVIQGPEAIDLEIKKIEDQERNLAERKKTLKTIRQGVDK